MSNFEQAISVILSHEGTETNHWVDDPSDLGGETQWGISMMFIRAEKLKPSDLGLNQDVFTPGSLKAVTKSTCEDIYRKFWWDRYGFGKIADQVCATKVFDIAVNCGARRSAKLAQAAVCNLGCTVIVDGAFGNITYNAINQCEPRKFVKALALVQSQYYEDIIKSRPLNAKFRTNWLRRAKWGVQ